MSETILLVEDEAPVRSIERRILARRGYNVIEATNGREALRTAKLHTGGIDMVVTDIVMPEMSGTAFAQAFVALYPRTPVLFVSGYTDHDLLGSDVLAVPSAFLSKPFTPDMLLEAVDSMLAGVRSCEGSDAAFQKRAS